MGEQKEKMVQIERSLFIDCILCIVAETQDPEVWERAAKRLEEKLQRMANRELYTKYLTATTEEEREKARQEYLDRIGMPASYRWSRSDDGKGV